MRRGTPGIAPSLTTQRLYFRQETWIRQPDPGTASSRSSQLCLLLTLPGCGTQNIFVHLGSACTLIFHPQPKHK